MPAQDPQKPPRRLVSIVLAAGKGTRMRSPDRHKVCMLLDGQPVIARALASYARCGAAAHYVVVGVMAEPVMRAAESAPGSVVFCHQAEQRGTGHAAKVAAEALRASGYEGDMLVVAGDKVIEDSALCRLVDAFHESGADLAFLTGDVSDFPTAGRVVPGENGEPAGISEVFDISRAQVLTAMRRITGERPIAAGEAERMALSAFGREEKAALALGRLWDAIRAGQAVTRELMDTLTGPRDRCLRLNGRDVPANEISHARQANLSVYLFRASALYESLDRLTADNAQREEYLTDTVGILANMGRRVITVPVARPTEAMAFNSPEEFERIVAHVEGEPAHRAATREAPQSTRPVSGWLSALEKPGATRALAHIYGNGDADLKAKRLLLRDALEAYGRRFGDAPVLIARAPGRLNIMGRHVDHQGGAGNLIAISRDIFAVMGMRDDDRILLDSTDPNAFPERGFSVTEVMEGYTGGDWLDFVNGETVRGRNISAAGDWALYAQAVVARLQARSERTGLRGFNAVVSGDIPIAAGLSSSSALVVALAEGIAAQNALRIAPEEFVALCGEAEWYTGTRGGAGDHAAMKFGRRGRVVQFGSLPFGVLDTVPFPDDAAFVVCDSHVQARKTAGARDAFNQRVACYHIGRELLKSRRPDLAPRIEHLRDVNTRTLGIDLPDLIALLQTLPECLNRDEARALLPEDVAGPLLATHSEPARGYPIRAVVLFGLAECERSRTCVDLLRDGDLPAFGRWMNTSHDGDRVTVWDEHGDARPFRADVSDAAMAHWREQAASGAAAAALTEQTGAYTCSTQDIDRMVDTVLRVPGVLGAQISGAGLGGCMMALARRESVEAVRDTLRQRYYDPLGLEPGVFACAPVDGSGLIRL